MMGREFLLGLSLCLLILACIGVAEATDYYVAPWGNDSNPGTPEQPWQHPSYAAQQAQAGDTIYLIDSRSDPTAIEAPINGTLTFTNNSTIVTGVGTNFTSELVPGNWIKSDNSTYGGEWYEVASIINDTYLELSTPFANETHSSTAKKNLVWINEQVSFANSGNATHPIVMKAYNGTPTLDGVDKTGTGIEIYKGKHYITIEGLTIKNYQYGIHIVGDAEHPCTYINISNNTIYNVSVAIFGQGYSEWESLFNFKISNNHISSFTGSGIQFYGGLINSTINDNYVVDAPQAAGLVGIGYSFRNCIIENNYVANITTTYGISSGGYGGNSIYRNNIIENISGRGIRLGPSFETNITITGNIIRNTGDFSINLYPHFSGIIESNIIENAGATSCSYPDEIIFRNNIFNNVEIRISGCDDDPLYGTIHPNITFTNNIFRNANDKWIQLIRLNHLIMKNNIFHNISKTYLICLGLAEGIINNTEISNNVFYDITGSVIYLGGNAVVNATIKNNIFMNISGNCVKNDSGININVSYNDVYNCGSPYFVGVTATNTLEKDPLFADPPDDFHLKSKYGRWNGTDWVKDNVNSPCIDAGDPEDDYSNEPEPNGGRINLGAYGNTPEASKSGVIVTAPANKWTSFRMHPSYNLTFEQISANLTNHLALSYYNKSIGLWQSYWVGYDFNKNVVVSERESLFAYFTADTNLSCGIYAPEAKPLKADKTVPLYLRGFGNKKIEQIKSALVADGCNVVQVCGWDKVNQEWNCTDDFVVHPSEGFIVQTSNDCVWREIV